MRKTRGKYHENSTIYNIFEAFRTQWATISLVFSMGVLGALLGAIITSLDSQVTWIIVAILFSGLITGLFILVGLKLLLSSWHDNWYQEKAQKFINNLLLLSTELSNNIQAEKQQYLEVNAWLEIRKETEMFPVELYNQLTEAYLQIAVTKSCQEKITPAALSDYIYNELKLVEILGKVNNLKENYKRTYFK